MMKIDGRSPVQSAGTQAPQRNAAAGEGFVLPKAAKPEAAERTARTLSAHASIPLDTLIAVQAQEDAGERRKRQARRGHDLLDGLDRLKASLLGGRVPLAELERLKSTLSQRREMTDDPRLDDVLSHVELRVAVELAKLGR
jgi:Class II flagellar assembly regulator